MKLELKAKELGMVWPQEVRVFAESGSESQVANPSPNILATVTVIIPQGSSGKEIAEILYQKQVIKETDKFVRLLEKTDLDKKLTEGKYTLPVGGDPLDVLLKLYQ
ncbi:MAG: hypothetical protein ACYC2T_03005 [Bacillota bacterium]